VADSKHAPVISSAVIARRKKVYQNREIQDLFLFASRTMKSLSAATNCGETLFIK